MPDPAFWALAAACALTVWGFGWIALAHEPHWQQVFEVPGGPARATRLLLRVLGAALLAASLALCLMSDHASMAVLVWLMLLANAAVWLAMLLSWRPAWLRALWPAPHFRTPRQRR